MSDNSLKNLRRFTSSHQPTQRPGRRGPYLKTLFRKYGSMKIDHTHPDVGQIIEELGEDNVTMTELLVIRLFNNAMNGDRPSLEVIAPYLGTNGKPITKRQFLARYREIEKAS